MKRIIFIASLILFLSIAINVEADVPGGERNFYVDSNYDLYQREEISVYLEKMGQETYFYVDSQWWEGLAYQEKQVVKLALKELDQEFQQRIYPILTNTFGHEWKPGIDNDYRITILIHPMKKNAKGYFNSGDEYLTLENPRSNEREMIYLNADFITSSLAKTFLAHEFLHLITFNQKEKIHSVQEDIWLNEARAEYTPTLLGYDKQYEGSNLQQRARTFLENPSNSLTEWQGERADYGILNLFTQYLVEQYGVEVLVDSLKSEKTGIASINEALDKRGFKEDFSQVFTDWTIAVLVNDCSLGGKYCYKNENLKNIEIIPLLNFLPIQGKSTLGVTQTTKAWEGNWLKFIGGSGTLKIEFIGNPEASFKVPYLAKDFSGKYILNYFQLDENQRGEILISNFGSEVNSIIILPSAQNRITGFLNPEPSFSFFWSASVTKEEAEKDFSKYLEKPISEMSTKEILARITEIEELLNQLKNQLASLTNPTKTSCQKFEENLYYGIMNNEKVKCLQEFLKFQGPEIYPEGLVTGNFLTLTKAAVIRFQEKYALEILTPWQLTRGTGFVGSTTMAKINEILGK